MKKKKKRKKRKTSTVEIYNKFLEKEEPYFKEYLGYGKKEIERIGVFKFLKAMDWTDESQISSWRTDALHIIPCTVCNNEFSIYETEFGICNKCAKDYDIKKLRAFMGQAKVDTETYISANLAIRDLIFLNGHFKIKKEDDNEEKI